MTDRYIPTLFNFESFDQELRSLAQLLRRTSLANEASDVYGVTMGETEDSIFVDLPMPGCEKEKIQITFERGSLLVCSEEERKEKEEQKGVKYYTRSSRAFTYRVPIPARIDEQSEPEAVYKNGILHIRFPKSRASKPQKIRIKGE